MAFRHVRGAFLNRLLILAESQHKTNSFRRTLKCCSTVKILDLMNKNYVAPFSSIGFSSSNELPKITHEEFELFESKGVLRELNMRTLTCADLPNIPNANVTLIGWIERCEGSSIFLKDGYGNTQCVIPAENDELHKLLSTLKKSDVITLSGTVVPNSRNESTVLVDSIILLAQEETHKCHNTHETFLNSFSCRTHTCGELRPVNVGRKVTVCGWLEYQRMSKFLLLRDSYGLVQCLVPESSDISNIPLESILKVEGIVAMRPLSMINHSMPTGEVEIIVENIEVLNIVDNIPFTLRKHQKPKEQLRLQHRYVDLRFPEMQNNLRLRSLWLHKMRGYLIDRHAFVEVETPTLFCRTPGGAREFLVPTRHCGLFYSLVQSPQQFKQMLMVGGIDRYFQVARCYRDETTRPDRQPEFTQLDIELSFTDINGIFDLIEQLLYTTYPVPISKPPFQRMTYREALETYGSDKPDVTFSMKLHNITSCINNVHSINDFASYALALPEDYVKISNKIKESVKELKKRYKNVQIIDNRQLIRDFSEDTARRIAAELILKDSSLFYVAIGPNDEACQCLGELRLLLAQELKSKGLLKINNSIAEPLWIMDFPLFVKGENGLETCHHPFTAPHPDDVNLLENAPLNVRSLAYDLVMNGNELGGGSVRIHNADLQLKILKMLNIDPGTMEHFVKALRSGCPPHAGIALGIDRMLAQACHAESIRDVIAFPKSHEGKDPLSGAPNAISEDDRLYYNLDLKQNVEGVRINNKIL